MASVAASSDPPPPRAYGCTCADDARRHTWWVVVVVAVVVEGAELRDVTEVETSLHSSLAQALPPPCPIACTRALCTAA
jgi:hypothetical protein